MGSIVAVENGLFTIVPALCCRCLLLSRYYNQAPVSFFLDHHDRIAPIDGLEHGSRAALRLWQTP